jgi:8-oxo-dGTP diphosphatase
MTAPVTRVGVGVLVVRNGRVLLGQRQGSHGAGTWALPGGHLDFGESAAACAARELFEETGLMARDFHHAQFTVDDFPVEGRHYVTLFVEAREVVGEPANLEPDKCVGWEWYDWHALPAPLFGPLESLHAMGFVPSEVRQ